MANNLSPYNIPIRDARTLFLDTLLQIQAGRHPVSSLRQWLSDQRSNLDQQWSTLETLAHEDLVSQMRTHLEVFLQAWAYYRALEWIIQNPPGGYIDPADADVYNKVERELHERLTLWSSQLQICWQQGERERTQAQLQQQQNWQGIAVGLFKEQRMSWQLDHQVGQRWAGVALNGVEQAQRGVEQFYSFAAATQSHVAGLLQATQRSVEQHLPEAVREAAREARGRRTASTLMWFLGICLLGIALMGLAVLIGTHL
jgi:hypothetical protein